MGGDLNAPWGMAAAPADIAPNALVVGNFGDGHLTLFDLGTGRELGQLLDKSGAPIAVEGLWGIIFGNDDYFAAGPGDEEHGLFGCIQVAAAMAAPWATACG